MLYITGAVQITNNWRTELTRTYKSEMAKNVTYQLLLHCLRIKNFDHAYITKPEAQ